MIEKTKTKLLIIASGLLFISLVVNVFWYQDKQYLWGQIEEFQRASSLDLVLIKSMNANLKVCGEYLDVSKVAVLSAYDGKMIEADKYAGQMAEMFTKFIELDKSVDKAYYDREENVKNNKFIGSRKTNN